MLVLSKKREISLLLLIIICLTQSILVSAFSIPKPTAAFYVNDSADLINVKNEDYIITANEALCANTGAQIVVVTIDSLEGTSIEEYPESFNRQRRGLIDAWISPLYYYFFLIF